MKRGMLVVFIGLVWLVFVLTIGLASALTSCLGPIHDCSGFSDPDSCLTGISPGACLWAPAPLEKCLANVCTTLPESGCGSVCDEAKCHGCGWDSNVQVCIAQGLCQRCNEIPPFSAFSSSSLEGVRSSEVLSVCSSLIDNAVFSNVMAKELSDMSKCSAVPYRGCFQEAKFWSFCSRIVRSFPTQQWTVASGVSVNGRGADEVYSTAISKAKDDLKTQQLLLYFDCYYPSSLDPAPSIFSGVIITTVTRERTSGGDLFWLAEMSFTYNQHCVVGGKYDLTGKSDVGWTCEEMP